MKELSERQKLAFEEIKRKKRNGKDFSDWEKKLIYDLGLQSELEETEIEKPKPQNKDCPVCLGEERFTFRRLIDDFQTIREVLMNLKGTEWSFACPACNGKNKDIRPVESTLLENAGWLFLNNQIDKVRLEKFFFYYEGDLSA